MSFDVAGGAEEAQRVETSVRKIKNATSLGGTRSVLETRARWEGDRVPENLVRLSVGLEPVDETWADLEQALGPRAGGRTRTDAPGFTKPVLYQLSYSGSAHMVERQRRGVRTAADQPPGRPGVPASSPAG